jgi:hypothetical protein
MLGGRRPHEGAGRSNDAAACGEAEGMDYRKGISLCGLDGNPRAAYLQVVKRKKRAVSHAMNPGQGLGMDYCCNTGDVRKLIEVVMQYQSVGHAEGTKQYVALISQYLHPAPASMLDIGCNEGLILAGLAGKETAGYGYEANANYYKSAVELNKGNTRLKFFNKIVQSEDIQELPDVDVAIFLSVHHQIVRKKGLDYGNDFLAKLFRKVRDKLFFSPAMIYAKYRHEMPFPENDYKAATSYFLDVMQKVADGPIYARSIGIASNYMPPSEPYRPIILMSKSPIDLEIRGGAAKAAASA